MKTLKLKIVLLFCLVSMVCMGQKCKNSKKVSRKAKKHLVEETIIEATKYRRLFSKFSQAAATGLVKSNEGYYLSLLLVREFGRRIDIMDDNPLVIQFKNDSIVTLYPDKSILGKFTLPVTTEINRPFYRVDRKQLELFAAQSIFHVKIYFTSDKVSENKQGVDDLGTFFDFEILNEHYQSNLIDAANCMLRL
jgi:hypothetical protein